MTDIHYTLFLSQIISKLCTAFASAKFMTKCQKYELPYGKSEKFATAQLCIIIEIYAFLRADIF